MNQLQEVLDKIKATEMKNEELMQALRQKVNDYELELNTNMKPYKIRIKLN